MYKSEPGCKCTCRCREDADVDAYIDVGIILTRLPPHTAVERLCLNGEFDTRIGAVRPGEIGRATATPVLGRPHHRGAKVDDSFRFQRIRNQNLTTVSDSRESGTKS